MTTSSLIEILELFLATGLLIWLFKGPWQSLLIDLTRQRLFEGRDQLFLFAAEGKLNFESKVYKETRDYLNDSIRLCHRIGLRSILASSISRPNENHESGNKREYLIDTLNEIENIEFRKQVKEVIMNATKQLMILMIFRSIIVLPLIIIYSIYAKLKGRYSKLPILIEHIIERDIKMGDA